MRTCPLFAKLAALVLALALTLSCSDDKDDGSDPNLGVGSSSSDGNLSGLSSSSGVNNSSSSSRAGSSSSSVVINIVYGADVDYGNETYKTVVIGEQTWFQRNLNYEPSGTGVATNSKCYNDEPSKCTQYGRLYDWATAMKLPASCNSDTCADQVQPKHQGICLSGWHIPSNADWDQLMRSVDGTSGTSSPYYSPTAGRYLKATSDWSNSCGVGSSYSFQCEDKYGFSALPGGYANYDGDFISVSYFGRWWSASEDELFVLAGTFSYAYYRGMGFSDEKVNGTSIRKDDGLFSVRCVKD